MKMLIIDRLGGLAYIICVRDTLFGCISGIFSTFNLRTCRWITKSSNGYSSLLR